MVRLLALLLALFVSSTAMAEELPPDPPQQIGRVASISGAVSYQARGDAPASEVSVNFPLTGGNRIATSSSSGEGPGRTGGDAADPGDKRGDTHSRRDDPTANTADHT